MCAEHLILKFESKLEAQIHPEFIFDASSIHPMQFNLGLEIRDRNLFEMEMKIQ